MKLEVDAMKFENEFDIVCSFWCLHWLTDFKRAFNNIYHALRPKGQALLILTAGEDPHAWTYLALKNQKRFKSLENFISPIDYEKLLTLEQSIANLPFSDLSVSRPPVSIPLPNLTLLRQFFEGISFFYRGQLNDSEIHEVIEAQLEIFDTHCKEKFDGRYLFELKPYVITLTK
jgi:SAM-dependent methyltransferase